MKKKVLISIIIPIYNADKYLQVLLNSILMQTFSNYEVLLINDGSTDNSEEICLDGMKKNDKIKYFKKENTGVSATRNFGIEHAIGKYICFVDADDVLTNHYLSDLITTIEENDSDMSCCNYIKFNSEIVEYDNDDSKLKIYTGINKYDLIYDRYGGYLWNKLFAKNIIINNNIKFNSEIGMCEDMLFIFEYLKYTNKISCINNINYNYRIIENSASKDIHNLKWFSIFKTLDKIIESNNLYSSKTFNNVMYSYMYYLYEAKYRLKYNKGNKEYTRLKENIKNRFKNIKKQNICFTHKQILKLSIYKYFNTIAFKMKKRKENRI